MTRLHKNVGNNPEEIPGGRLLAPGETADVDENHPHVKMLIDDEKLVDVHQDQTDEENTKSKSGGKSE